MKCANCARDNPTGARYCVHCGTEQSVPTPIAAAAAMASRARGGIPQAANAAHAEPVHDDPAHDGPAPPARRSIPPKAVASGGAPPDASRADAPRASRPRVAHATLPAYASAPKRTGLAFSIVVACLVAAAAMFFAWRMLAPDAFVNAGNQNDGRGSVMSGLPGTSATRQDRVPPGDTQAGAGATSTREAENPSEAPPVASGDKTATAPSMQGANADALAGGARASSASPPPVEITPLPAKPALRATKKAAPEPEKQIAPVPATPVSPAASTPAAPSPPLGVAAAGRKSTAAADPWARMREELETCTREDFITRVICGQRVRFRYCADYWGKVPECPGNPTPDHGQ